MRRLISCLLLGCLVVVGAAAANHQDPQKRLTKADNARARAMLVKQSDLPAGFRVQPSSDDDPHYTCPASVSEADLTLTGEAHGKSFTTGVTFVESGSQVYESDADARASWRRSTSTAGIGCLSTLLRREYAKQGLNLVSLRKTAFPRVGERTIAFRIEIAAQSAQGTVPIFIDLVAQLHSRAQATVIVGAGVVAPPRAEEVRLARLVADRMARAMRGA